ncbi:MAG TPA: hypothetical protein VF813_08810 [Anaerolineaceae bacterium]
MPLGALGVFSFPRVHPNTHTAIGRAGKGKAVIGQARFEHAAHRARLSLILPADSLDSIVLPGLLDYLAVQAGLSGALHFSAEVDEGSCVFESLRRAGFSVYAWQRVWKFPAGAEAGAPAGGEPSPNDTGTVWRPFRRRSDLNGARALYQSLVPALVQSIESPPAHASRGLVYQPGSDLLAYADLVYGPLGIWVQPFIHPSSEDVMALLDRMVRAVPYRRSRPLYVCVRSYQSWFESSLEELGAARGERQALMVKHLAIAERQTQALRIPALHRSPSAAKAAKIAGLVRRG